MPLILAITDFSSVSDNAVIYACNLAAAQNAQVSIVNTFVVPVMFTDMPIPTTLMNDSQRDAEDQMAMLLVRVREMFPSLEINGEVLYGDVTDIVAEKNKEHITPWIIVVGNNSTDAGATTFDSTLIDAFKRSKYPVLAVPPGAAYTPVYKLCFAYDNKPKGNDIALQQLKEITRRLNATLYVLYADPDVHNQDNETDISASTKNLLVDVNPIYHFTNDVSVEDAIKNFVGEQQIDWLIVLPRKHSFFEGLFHKSHSMAMAHTTRIPVVALHEA